MFNEVPTAPDFPTLETTVLKYWREKDIQKQALQKSKPGLRPFVFFEGPPTANGRPGIHHVSARAVKDVFCRFKTMQGYRVDRRAGWDTHGLPVEIEVEKEIGSKGKQDIERFGVAAFNQKCRESVFRYITDWRTLTERIGFWIDFDRAYITYERDYIESEWWILKNLWDRGLFYQDYKTTMHCTRCNTSLADHEVSQGMKEDVDDPSVWVKFDVSHTDLAARGIIASDEKRPVSLLVWTTTPWTIGANSAIGVAPGIKYALIAAPPYWGSPQGSPEELYIVADGMVDTIFEQGRAHRVRLVEPAELLGVPYAPVLLGQILGAETPAFRRVLIDEAVETTAGTGVLHIAPAYGDLSIGQAHGLPVLFSAGRDGMMLSEVRAPESSEASPFVGLFFKAADKEIIRDMRARGRLFRSERIKHAFPLCWRDDTPLMFLAKTSWYLRTTSVKEKLLSNNQAINWVPSNVRDGRFGRWLENNVDWAISRERFWGCPLPVWLSEQEDAICVGSVAELEALCGRSLSAVDLHRPMIDEVIFELNGKSYRRVPDTVDVWFDSGVMPYCQWHYPFENKDAFEQQFPADFISEAMDQTRGWFYSLHAISTLLTFSGDSHTPPGPLADRWPDSSAFRNVVVQGFINDEQDRKMSKSRGNTVDPWSVLNKEGCDPLRWYILGNAPPGKNLAFKREDISKQSLKQFFTLWNVYSFFVTYANLSRPDLSAKTPLSERPEIDRWLEAKRNQLVMAVTEALESFDAAEAVALIGDFIDRDLSNWYLRRNRRRFWGRVDEGQGDSAFQCLFDALMTTTSLLAPFAPFFAEALYLNLARATSDACPSIHLSDWPTANLGAIDAGLIDAMSLVVEVVHLGRSARTKSNLRVRQPLRRIHLRVRNEEERRIVAGYADLIRDELNIHDVSFTGESEVVQFADFSVRPNFATLGKRLGPKLSALRKLLSQSVTQQKVVAALLAGDNLSLELDGSEETFAPEDFLLDLNDRGGFAVALDRGLMVALETDLDSELIEEGRVREVLRQLQDARRRVGLLVSDRIVLSFEGEGAASWVALNAARLAEDLLAVRVDVGPMADALFAETIDMEEMQLQAFLKRA